MKKLAAMTDDELLDAYNNDNDRYPWSDRDKLDVRREIETRLAAMQKKDEKIEKLKDDCRRESDKVLFLTADLEDMNRRIKQLIEEGIAIMHDQGAENLLLKDQIAEKDAEIGRLKAEIARLQRLITNYIARGVYV
jgi:peptidoglycan hydrolase CwlO-like protein